jgi:hypothetical protein
LALGVGNRALAVPVGQGIHAPRGSRAKFPSEHESGYVRRQVTLFRVNDIRKQVGFCEDR